MLRGLLELRPAGEPIPIEEVEPATEILKRFTTGAMSLGALGPEAHETLAVAMNRIGGMSNSGEGGEDIRRYGPTRTATSAARAIKQVASGRFGVTVHYLSSADQIQIKIAQGAKPGEGGQLPGHKVDPYIAQLRFATPGVGLISPPPHHDIYSIEDLKQLIYDLRAANPQATVSVKLAAEAGVGTVAAGVAKAGADHVVIAGHDGGTGASPLSSIQQAGVPWEIGLAETQQTLLRNDLRIADHRAGRRRHAHGPRRVIGAMLGADEFGFSTAPLDRDRLHHDARLPPQHLPGRGRDPGPGAARAASPARPEHVVNYLYPRRRGRPRASSPARRPHARGADRPGRAARASSRRAAGPQAPAARPLRPAGRPGDRRPRRARRRGPRPRAARRRTSTYASCSTAAAGARAAASRCGSSAGHATSTAPSAAGSRTRSSPPTAPSGLADDTIAVTLHGSAGQSFGAWLAPGSRRSSSRARPTTTSARASPAACSRSARRPSRRYVAAEDNVIIGNVALYGATGGRAFFRGLAGERFAVRNSGASAVVEGVGDHGCEYMTGGRVVVLGPTGPQLRRRDERRHRLRPRPRRAASPCARNTELVDLEPLDATTATRAARRWSREHLAAHRLGGRRAAARRLGRSGRRVRQGDPARLRARASSARRAAAAPKPRVQDARSVMRARSDRVRSWRSARVPARARSGRAGRATTTRSSASCPPTELQPPGRALHGLRRPRSATRPARSAT